MERMKRSSCDDGSLPASSSRTSSSSSSCANSEVLLARIDKVKTELANVKEKIGQVTGAVERRAATSQNVDSLLQYAIQDFKELATENINEDEDPPSVPAAQVATFARKSTCSCSNCGNLVKREQFLMCKFQRLRIEILERTTDMQILAQDSFDKLLVVLIDRIKIVAEAMSLTQTTLSTEGDDQQECGSSPKKFKMEPHCPSTETMLDKPNQSNMTTKNCLLMNPTLAEPSCSTSSNMNDNDTQPGGFSERTFIIKVEEADDESQNEPVVMESEPGLFNATSFMDPEMESAPNVDIDGDHHQQVKYEPKSSTNFQPIVVMPASSSSFDQHQRQSVEEVALSEPKILQKIIDSLDYLDLKTSRLVNRQWQKLSTTSFLNRDISSVVIQYDSKAGLFRKSSWLEWNLGRGHCAKISLHQPLSELNKVLKKSKNFPCTSFALYRCNLGNLMIENFFKIQGSNIHQLFLKGDSKTTSKSTLKNLLENFVPNLKYLEIRSFDYPWKNNEAIAIPSLDFLSFPFCSKTGGAILRGSPNLLEVADPMGDYSRVKFVVESGKMSLVKTIRCDEDTELRSLAYFANGKSQLTQLICSVDKKVVKHPMAVKTQLADYFTKILEASQNTLEDLYLSGLFPVSRIKYPEKLERLKFLDLDWEQLPVPTPCFPKRLNLALTFPNIHVLDCGTLHSSKDENWDVHFPPGSLVGTLSSVETLCIADTCTSLWMKRLHRLCPQFKTLVVWAEWDVHVLLPTVFKMWSHLESIELKVFRLGKEKAGKKRFHLDSAFTGISHQDCQKLLLDQVPFADVERVGPSITDLKGLKRLWISFICPHADLVRTMQNSVLVTKISGIYAFSKMPRLKLTIGYDQNCQYSKDIREALASVAPFVNFTHKHVFSNDQKPPMSSRCSRRDE